MTCSLIVRYCASFFAIVSCILTSGCMSVPSPSGMIQSLNSAFTGQQQDTRTAQMRPRQSAASVAGYSEATEPITETPGIEPGPVRNAGHTRQVGEPTPSSYHRAAHGMGFAESARKSRTPLRQSTRTRMFYDDINQTFSDPLVDRRARKVGDIITVLVNVGTTVNNQDQRQMDKTTNSEANADTEASGSSAYNINYGTSSNRRLQGRTQLQETRRFTDQITATVVGVRGNNLIIQGSRSVQIQGDFRTLVLSGIVNRDNIQNNNTVRSDRIHNLQLDYDGKGSEQQYLREGWLKKIVSVAWPF